MQPQAVPHRCHHDSSGWVRFISAECANAQHARPVFYVIRLILWCMHLYSQIMEDSAALGKMPGQLQPHSQACLLLHLRSARLECLGNKHTVGSAYRSCDFTWGGDIWSLPDTIGNLFKTLCMESCTLFPRTYALSGCHGFQCGDSTCNLLCGVGVHQLFDEGCKALSNEVKACCIWMQAIWHHLLHIESQKTHLPCRITWER